MVIREADVQALRDVSACRTLVALLQTRAQLHPERVLYRFLAEGEREEAVITFEQLEYKAKAIAAELQALKVPGERGLLLYPPGLDFIAAFFGCLYAGVIAVPVYPPNPLRPERGLSRFLSIVANAKPAVVLTLNPILQMTEQLFAKAPGLVKMNWLASDAIADEHAQEWREPEIDGDTLAFLQYTSGSTATPKGVMVSHSNLLHNERVIHAAFEHNEQCSGVSWLPVYHDMGLIGTMLQPLYAGFPFTLMSPVDFLQRPFRWLNAISKYRATVSGGPNFAYDLCVRKVSDEQKQKIDLSSWDLAFSGAEPVQAATIDAFCKAFESCGFRREAFYPCYGLAESTLFVTGDLKSREPVVINIDSESLQEHRIIEVSSEDCGRRLVSCGKTWLDQKIVIVDPETLVPCQEGEVGEIWVAGPSVTCGYWGLDDETKRTFDAFTADESSGPFLRTGDLGFVKADELYVTGRCKDLIICNGRNYYPQDIEWTVERCHSGVRLGCSAVFSLEIEGEERLVVVAEVERRFQQDQKRETPLSGERREEDEPALSNGATSDFYEVTATIRRAIAQEHELPVHAVALLKSGSIPKTSSGKIQRHACKKAFSSESLEMLFKQ